METKKLTITPPEGFEIDQENSTFEEIVFKKIEKQVKVWYNSDLNKYCWIRNNNSVYSTSFTNWYQLLAFHTAKQRDEF